MFIPRLNLVEKGRQQIFLPRLHQDNRLGDGVPLFREAQHLRANDPGADCRDDDVHDNFEDRARVQPRRLDQLIRHGLHYLRRK